MSSVIDYLTISLHFKDKFVFGNVSDSANFVKSKFKHFDIKKARYPFSQFEVCKNEYGDDLVYIRYAVESGIHVPNKGFITFDFLGKFFETVTEFDISDVLEYMVDKMQFAESDKIKIARLDVKQDYEEYDTDYNPHNLEVKRMYAGTETVYGIKRTVMKGQPTYYYGSQDNQIRLYDKRKEYLDVDKVVIPQERLTRFEFQHRNIYVNPYHLLNFNEYCEQVLQYDLHKNFGLGQATSKCYVGYPSDPYYNFSVLKPYCTMMYVMREVLGDKEFNTFIDVYANENKVEAIKEKFQKNNMQQVSAFLNYYRNDDNVTKADHDSHQFELESAYIRDMLNKAEQLRIERFKL